MSYDFAETSIGKLNIISNKIGELIKMIESGNVDHTNILVCFDERILNTIPLLREEKKVFVEVFFKYAFLMKTYIQHANIIFDEEDKIAENDQLLNLLEDDDLDFFQFVKNMTDKDKDEFCISYQNTFNKIFLKLLSIKSALVTKPADVGHESFKDLLPDVPNFRGRSRQRLSQKAKRKTKKNKTKRIRRSSKKRRTKKS